MRRNLVALVQRYREIDPQASGRLDVGSEAKSNHAADPEEIHRKRREIAAQQSERAKEALGRS